MTDATQQGDLVLLRLLGVLAHAENRSLLYTVVGTPYSAYRISALDLRESREERVLLVTEDQHPEAWVAARRALANRLDDPEPKFVAVTPLIEEGVQGVYCA